jgi:hypothetical protein
MSTECDQCQWNNKQTLKNNNSLVCSKGERIWSGLQGLLRLDSKSNITYDPCPHLDLCQEPTTRFERILKGMSEPELRVREREG